MSGKRRIIVCMFVWLAGVFCLALSGVTYADSDNTSTMLARLGCGDSDSESFEEYIKPGWNNLVEYPGNKQVMIVASDPQAFRYIASRQPWEEGVGESQWREKIAPVLRAIRAERNQPYYVPVIINGDMSEFGHGKERKVTRSVFRENLPGRVAGPLMLPGLGNHDYSNNVNDCANNGCARDSVCDLITWVYPISMSARPQSAFDWTWRMPSTTTGSLAYSVTVGRVHIVQLNNEPSYTVNFSTGGAGTGKDKVYFNITSAMNWLEQDLAAASARGEQIIINFHRMDIWTTGLHRNGWFADMVKKYKVVAIFNGHDHRMFGKGRVLYGGVPVFYSGSLMGQSYLRLTFDWSFMTLKVEPVLLGSGVVKPEQMDLPLRSDPNMIAIQLYEGESFTGASCDFAIPRGTSRVRLDDTSCKGWGNRASSALIQRFPPTASLCFADNSLQRERCFYGKYSGNFSIKSFSGEPDLVPGMHMRSKGGGLNRAIISVAGGSVNPDDLRATLYKKPDMQGDSCSFYYERSLEHVKVADTSCGGGEYLNVGSLKVDNFQPGDTVCLRARQAGPERCISGNYSGSFSVDTLEGMPNLPDDLDVTVSGRPLNLTFGGFAKRPILQNARTLIVTLYDEENFEGNRCYGSYSTVGGDSAMPMSGIGCPGWEHRVASVKIENFLNDTVCLQGSNPTDQRCIRGNYKGAISLPSLSADTFELPEALTMATRGDVLHKNVATISRQSVPEGPQKSFHIILYKGENLTGDSCRFEYRRNKPEMDINEGGCINWGMFAKSAKVEDFVAGGTLCFRGYHGQERCFSGDYTGAFSIDSFNKAIQTPGGLRVTYRGGMMNQIIASVSQASKTPVKYPEITLYDKESRQGASCTFTMDREIVSIEATECNAFSKKARSALVGFDSGTVVFLGGEGVRASHAYTGVSGWVFEIPNFRETHALPSGLSMTRSGKDLAGDLRLIKFMSSNL
ncbi:hypothetical protein [Pseudomonas alloputida]|uniref:hypothetical protein n=1 Tax=Pseudomonas TaxID=286 RepID=UPI003EF00DFC